MAIIMRFPIIHLTLLTLLHVNNAQGTNDHQLAFYGSDFFTLPWNYASDQLPLGDVTRLKLDLKTAMTTCDLVELKNYNSRVTLKLKQGDIQLTVHEWFDEGSEQWHFACAQSVADARWHTVAVGLSRLRPPVISVNGARCERARIATEERDDEPAHDQSGSGEISIGRASGGEQHFRGRLSTDKCLFYPILCTRLFRVVSYERDCEKIFSQLTSQGDATTCISANGTVQFNALSNEQSKANSSPALRMHFTFRSYSMFQGIVVTLQQGPQSDSRRRRRRHGDAALTLLVHQGHMVLLKCVRAQAVVYLKSQAMVNDHLWHQVTIISNRHGLRLIVDELVVQRSIEQKEHELRRAQVTFGHLPGDHCANVNLPLSQGTMCIGKAHLNNLSMTFLTAAWSRNAQLACHHNATCAPMDNTVGDSYANLHNVVEVEVNEGGRVTLDASHFVNVLSLSDDEASVILVERPQHGQLYKLQENVQTPVDAFSKADLAYKVISYLHDHSETTDDDMTFEPGTFSQQREEEPKWLMVKIRVRPVNDPPSVTYPTGARLDMVQHTSIKLGAHFIRVADDDSEPKEVQLVVDQPKAYGLYFEHDNYPGEPVVKFTWQDLLQGSVNVVHTAGWTFNCTLRLVDKGSDMWVTTTEFQVQVHRARAKRVGQSTLLVVQGDVGMLTNEHLAYEIPYAGDSDDAQVIYDVVELPKFGIFQLQTADGQWEQADEFDQADVSAGRVRFVQSASTGGTTEDRSLLKVSSRSLGISTEAELTIRVAVERTKIFKRLPFTLVSKTKMSIGRQHLLACTFPRASFANDIVYSITKGPIYGNLMKRLRAQDQEATRRLGVYSNFTQDDVNEARVAYHLRSNGHYTILYDQFEFTVSTTRGVSTSYSFSITFIPENENAIQINRVVLAKRGEDKVITQSNLHIAMNRHDNFRYTVISSTKNGSVLLDNVALDQLANPTRRHFTTEHLRAGRLSYRHDGSQSVQDSMRLVASPLLDEHALEERMKFALWLKVKISPGHKGALRRKHDVDHVCHVTSNERKVLTTQDLWYSDVDDEEANEEVGSKNLHYHFWPNITQGQFYSNRLPGVGISQFSQHEINSGAISYVHTGAYGIHRLNYAITNGRHRLFDRLTIDAIKSTLHVRQADEALPMSTDLTVLDESRLTISSTVALVPQDVHFTIAYQSDVCRMYAGDESAGGDFESTHKFTLEQLKRGHVGYKCRPRRMVGVSDVNIFVSYNEHRASFSLRFSNAVTRGQTPTLVSVLRLGVITLSVQDFAAARWNASTSGDCVNRFLVKRRPEHGHLALVPLMQADKSSQLVDTEQFDIDQFTQHDVETARLHYIHNGQNEAEHWDRMDFYIVSPCTSDEPEPTTVRLAVKPMVRVTTKKIFVQSLRSRAIDLRAIHVHADTFPPNQRPIVAILKGPKMGKLIKEHQGTYKTDSHTFDEDDLKFQRLWYANENGSHGEEDQFEIQARLAGNDYRSAPQVVRIGIERRSDAAPTVLAIKPAILIAGKAWTSIGRKNLHIVDKTSAPDKVVVTILRAYKGHVALKDSMEKALRRFTLRDVNEDKLIFLTFADASEEVGRMGFSFVVSNDEHKTLPDWLEINFKMPPSAGLMERNVPLKVASGTKVPITNRYLHVGVDGVTTHNLVYSIIEKPKYGHVLVQQRASAIFTQYDIDNNYVDYNQSVTPTKWHQRDSFVYIVSTSAAHRNESLLAGAKQFNVAISPAYLDDQLDKDQYLRIRPVDVPFMGSVALTKEHLGLHVLQRTIEDELSTLWKRLPTNGWLEAQGESVARAGGHLLTDATPLAIYHHNSLALVDQVDVEIYAQAKDNVTRTRRNVLTVTLTCRVVPLSTSAESQFYGGAAPLSTVPMSFISVVQGGRKVLSVDDFSLVNQRAAHVFQVKKLPPNFELIRNGTDQERQETSQFTKADLQAGHMTLINNGNLDDGIWLLSVSSRLKENDWHLSQARLVVEPLTLSMHRGGGGGVIYYRQTEKTVPLNSERLLAESNGPAEEIRYELKGGPYNGTLLWNNGSTVRQFSQRDVDEGRVVYKPTNMNAHKDQMHLRVFNAFKVIENETVSFWVLPIVEQRDLIVTAGETATLTSEILTLDEGVQNQRALFKIEQPPRYGSLVLTGWTGDPQQAAIDSFDAGQLSANRVEYVSTMNEHRRNVEMDEFKFKLEIENLQPAIGQVTILLLPRRNGDTKDDDQSLSSEEESHLLKETGGTAFWQPNMYLYNDVIGIMLLFTCVVSIFIIIVRKNRIFGKKRRMLKNTEYSMRLTTDELAENVTKRTAGERAKRASVKHAVSLDDFRASLRQANDPWTADDEEEEEEVDEHTPRSDETRAPAHLNEKQVTTLPRGFCYRPTILSAGSLSKFQLADAQQVLRSSSTLTEDVAQLNANQYWV